MVAKPTSPPHSLRDVLQEEYRFAKLLLGAVDAQPARRLYVRSSMSSVETYAHAMRQEALKRHVQREREGGPPLFRPEEICALREGLPQIEDSGEVALRIQFAPSAKVLLMSMRAYHKALDPQYELDYEAGVPRLRAAVAVRNRITHMRRAQDAYVGDADIEAVKQTFGWYVIHFNLLAARPMTEEEVAEWDREEAARRESRRSMPDRPPEGVA